MAERKALVINNGAIEQLQAGDSLESETDERVKIDADAGAGYLGAASNDGVLQTGVGLSYVDDGNFVTLALSHLGIQLLTNPGGDRILFWDDSESAFKWLAVSDYLTLSGATLSCNPGFVSRGDPTDWDYILGNPFIGDATWRDLDVSSIVPAGAYAVELLVFMIAASPGKVTYFRKKGHTGGHNTPCVISQVAGISHENSCMVECDSNRVIQYNFTPGLTVARVLVRGWWI